MKNRSIKFPKDKTLKNIRSRLEKNEGTLLLSPNAGAVDKAKYEICKQIIIYIRKKGISQKELANIFKTPETRVSEIVHYKIKKFTLDKLTSYYEIINPNFVLKVA